MIAVVIPSYRVSNYILDLLTRIGPEVSKIYVVDDACPDRSGALVQANCRDPRVRVIFHELNLGVGGATLSGFRQANLDGATIFVKLDGDGQMDPELIPRLVKPIESGKADFAKGNRFFSLEDIIQMPRMRLIGNGCLSFLTKLSSGYWSIMDPTNGFLAIHREVFIILPCAKIDRRYFFESDMLFRLGTIRAVVADVPMKAKYGDEVSNLKIHNIILQFSRKHLSCIFKRVIYSYYLRDFNLASMLFVFALMFFFGGTGFAMWQWMAHNNAGTSTPTGTVMLAVLPIILGFQLLLFALNFDILNEPKDVLHTLLK